VIKIFNHDAVLVILFLSLFVTETVPLPA